MRRFAVLSLLLLVVCFGGAATASADTVKLIKFGDQIPGFGSGGPFQGTLNGNSIAMVCMSFNRTVTVGQTWQVNVNALTASGVANALYGGQANALFKYQQAAFLYDQITLHPDSRADIQVAIWNIFNPAITPDTTGSGAWLTLAASQNFTGYDFSKFRILTPLDRSSRGPQEMLTTVPEPTTMLLLGTGLAAIGAKFRKRRRPRV
jgi:hypothetical protein